MTASNENLSVGQLAEEFALTVRTLHHWESIGLLTPSRSEGGHRVYGPAEQARVRDVLVLRELGLPLDEVRRAIDEPTTFDLTSFLAQEGDRITEQIDQLTTRRSAIQATLDTAGPHASPRTLLDALERLRTSLAELTPAQLRRLEQVNAALSDEHLHDLTERSTTLLNELRALHASARTPDDPDVLRAARLSRELLIETTGGDVDLALMLERMSLQPGFGDGFGGIGEIDDELRAWLRDTVAHLPAQR